MKVSSDISGKTCFHQWGFLTFARVRLGTCQYRRYRVPWKQARKQSRVWGHIRPGLSSGGQSGPGLTGGPATCFIYPSSLPPARPQMSPTHLLAMFWTHHDRAIIPWCKESLFFSTEHSRRKDILKVQAVKHLPIVQNGQMIRYKAVKEGLTTLSTEEREGGGSLGALWG